MTGIPRPRCLVVPGFGMNTRLTGRAVHEAARCCTQSASSALDCGSSTTFPSTPAVLRPALSSVTRRTLSSVFARDRSISFCRLRTRSRSPACDAVKILCRRRPTSSSTCRQSIDSQSVTSSSGPFAILRGPAVACAAAGVRVVMASNLSFGSVSLFSESPQAHPAHVSTLSGPGSTPVSGQLSGRIWRRTREISRFPAAFRLPAFACWAILFPLGS